MKMAIEAACRLLIDSESLLTEMDREVGDGDLGSDLARGSRALLSQLNEFSTGDATATLREIRLILEDVLGGSSGPLYGVLFLKASAALNAAASSELENWATAIEAGCSAITEVGGARARRSHHARCAAAVCRGTHGRRSTKRGFIGSS